MKAEKLNLGWKIKKGIDQPFDAIFAPGAGLGEDVILPQDAMILEAREKNCKSRAQSGFYPAGTYTYTREFTAPKNWEGMVQILELEGVMSRSMTYLNGNRIAAHKYGYSSLFVNLTPHLNYGESNKLKVISINNDLGSRWYPGSGIYRDVLLWQGGEICIKPEDLRVTTEYLGDGYAALRIDYRVSNFSHRTTLAQAQIEILDQEGKTVEEEKQMIYAAADDAFGFSCRITVKNPLLWSVDTPDLYRVRIRLRRDGNLLDEYEDDFGIRTLALDAKSGLTVNGKEVKLRGACIHHDNGIIGATTLYRAEEYRIRKLKEAGFNSIRSAHNPVSKAMLRACDRLGVLVMDELGDMWNEPKNENDYTMDFQDGWEAEVVRMVSKDYNHPSVVLYSTGNEIPELGRSSGAVMNQKIAAKLRREDGTRFVTCGISGFLAVADHMGEYASAAASQEEREAQAESISAGNALQEGREAQAERISAGNASQEEREAQAESISAGNASQERERTGGSEELNSMMGAAQKQMMDAFSISQVLTDCIEPTEAQLDVIGYNYLTARHEFEHTLHPNRIIVGSETYPPEIPDLWRIVMRNPYVIGDFSWTGYDYLGEAGIGIYHYDADRNDQGWYPDRLAYVGDIDINGNRRTISYLREIVYGLRKTPYLAVERVDKQGHKVDRNNWKYVDSIHSWTFPGYEGTVTRIHVLSGYPEVELFLNGRSLGRRSIGEEDRFTAVYETPYESGTLRAVAYEEGKQAAEDILCTADSPSRMKVGLSQETMAAGGDDLCFVTVDLEDEKGNWSRFEARRITIQVEGAGNLAGFGSADPSCEGSYQDTAAETYDGRIMAAVRSGLEPGTVRIRLTAEGFEDRELLLEVRQDGRQPEQGAWTGRKVFGA